MSYLLIAISALGFNLKAKILDSRFQILGHNNLIINNLCTPRFAI